MRKETDCYGTYYYNDLNQYHREDGPAIEETNGDKWWCRNGQWHREDGPACEWADGSKFWFRNGQYHREDGPLLSMLMVRNNTGFSISNTRPRKTI